MPGTTIAPIPSTSPAGLALAAACSAGFLWGTGALVVNVLISRYGFTPENISFWRFAVGALVLLAVFGRQVSWPRLRPRLGTVLLAGALLGERLGAWQWVGGVLLLLAIGGAGPAGDRGGPLTSTAKGVPPCVIPSPP